MFKYTALASLLALSLGVPYGFAISNYEEMEAKSRGVTVEATKPSKPRAGDFPFPFSFGQKTGEAYLDANELRLKARELSNQLLETWYPENIKGMVAYITTITSQDDLKEESSFGQYMRNALMYEFNQRGFAVRDFSSRNFIVNENGYAFGISDNKYKTSVLSSKSALVTGTYYRDSQYVFVNLRLIRGSDGMVLRTAQTILPVTPLIARMIKEKVKPLPPVLPSTSINIVQGE